MTIDDVTARLRSRLSDTHFSTGVVVADLRTLLDDHARLASICEGMDAAESRGIAAGRAEYRAVMVEANDLRRGAEVALSRAIEQHGAALDRCRREHAALVETAQGALARVTAERDSLRLACDGCADAEARTGRAHYDDCPIHLLLAERDRLASEVERLTRERAESVDSLARTGDAHAVYLAGLRAENARLAAALAAHEETIDTLRGDCQDGEHAPWCREWRAMAAERTALAAALAEMRAAVTEHREAMERQNDASSDAMTHWSVCAKRITVAWARVGAALASAPADLAAAHDRRVRAETLREAAEQLRRSDHYGREVIAGWLRTEADRIERGGR